MGQGHNDDDLVRVWWPNMTLIIDVLWLEYFFDFRVTTICRATISMETNAEDNNDAQYLEKSWGFIYTGRKWKRIHVWNSNQNLTLFMESLSPHRLCERTLDEFDWLFFAICVREIVTICKLLAKLFSCQNCKKHIYLGSLNMDQLILRNLEKFQRLFRFGNPDKSPLRATRPDGQVAQVLWKNYRCQQFPWGLCMMLFTQPKRKREKAKEPLVPSVEPSKHKRRRRCSLSRSLSRSVKIS